jgi:hypothetical protein
MPSAAASDLMNEGPLLSGRRQALNGRMWVTRDER